MNCLWDSGNNQTLCEHVNQQKVIKLLGTYITIKQWKTIVLLHHPFLTAAKFIITLFYGNYDIMIIFIKSYD